MIGTLVKHNRFPSESIIMRMFIHHKTAPKHRILPKSKNGDVIMMLGFDIDHRCIMDINIRAIAYGVYI